MPSLKDYIEKARKKGLTKKELMPALLQKGYSKKEIEDAFSSREQTQENEFLPLGEKIKGLFQPTTFFQSFRERKIWKALAIFSVASVLWLIANILIIFATSPGPTALSISGFFAILLFVFGFLAHFIWAGIAHILIRFDKHEGKFKDTYNTISYSLVPVAIISIIPYVGFLSIIYSIILMTFGLSHYHNISKGRAIIAAITPIILLIVLFVFYFFFNFF